MAQNKELLAQDCSSQFEHIMEYPVDFIQQITNNFEEQIGSGGFGRVFKGLTTENGHHQLVVAVKVINGPAHDELLRSDSANYKANIKDFFTALDVGQTIHKEGIKTENILPLLFFGMTPDLSTMCLAYKYMPNGSVRDWLTQKNGVLNWQQRVNIAIGTANGLCQLHENDIMHLDIKSPNILLDEHLEPFICDFGFARGSPTLSQCTHETVTNICGTEPWLPADYIATRQLCDKVDTYSYGIFLLELLTAKLPDYSEGPITLRHIFLQSRGPEMKMDIPSVLVNYLDEDFDNRSWKIILYKYAKNCTHHSRRNRPKMKEIWSGMINLRNAYQSKMASQRPS